ncbi:endoglin isoform X2 [Rhinatrema bivittatum]|uniref:endoglin isoform X2 n=1 Tax=Rhinatrema bivittatum TaxID=194408 RepID=UPI00112CDF57|nr:endoglin isoform X2 [Rhinatrema bivittatum]
MELALSLVVWGLCCPLLHAAPAATPDWEDMLPGQETPASVVYTSRRAVLGCLSKSPDKEVHVLNVTTSAELEIPELTLEVEAGVNSLPSNRKLLFVLHTEGYLKTSFSFRALTQSLPVSIDSSTFVLMLSNYEQLEVNKTDLPTDTEKLLKWAQKEYGGITSFTELQNPLKIHFKVGRDMHSPNDCIPKKGFNVTSYVESYYRPKEVKVCKLPELQKTKQALMLQVNWDQEVSSPLTNVNVIVERSVRNDDEDLLILKSNRDQSWNITSNCSIKIMTSGPFVLNGLQGSGLQKQMPQSLDELSKYCQNHGFHMASYMELLSASHVAVTLHNYDTKSTQEPVTITDDTSLSKKEQLQQMLALLRPWTCSQDSLEIVLAKHFFPVELNLNFAGITLRDPHCRAEENRTHVYLIVPVKSCLTETDHRQHVKNELLLTLIPSAETIQVPFECIPKQSPSVEMQLFRSSEFTKLSTIVEANKISYAQIVISAVTEESHLQLQECWLQLEGEQKRPLILMDAQSDPVVNVNILIPTKERPGMMTRQFSFIYRAEEGRLVQPATLKCLLCLQTKEISNGCPHHNRFEKSLEVILANSIAPLQVHGLGMVAVLSITFGAFLTGALLTAALWCIYSHTRPPAKLQPVPGNLAASESSSANHSIGSTQSTPCSTSSVA